MATITKRGKSYLISISCGYDDAGKQIRKTMTWKPESSMTVRQEKKAVKAAAVRFEDQVQSGQYIDPSITLSQFIDKWLTDYAEVSLRADTIAGYKANIPTIKAALGHLKLCKIQPQHIIEFYKNLSENGVRRDTKYQCTIDLQKILKENNILKKDAQAVFGISYATLFQAVKGRNISKASAESICRALKISMEKSFKPVGKDKLSGNTILHYHNLLKSIFSTAVHWQVLVYSPVDRVKAPKKEYVEQECLTAEEAQKLVCLLDGEPENRKAATLIALCSGMRRSELYALKWDSIDIDTCTVSICKTAVYVAKQGIVNGDTKNKKSTRVIKLPSCCQRVLLEYRAWYNEQRLACGDQWHDSNRLFVTWNGEPESPENFTTWFRTFRRKNNLSEGLHPHSLRHTNATLQIGAHQDIKTVSSRLGHSQTSTTLNVYAHAIQEADATAADVLNGLLTPSKKA